VRKGDVGSKQNRTGKSGSLLRNVGLKERGVKSGRKGGGVAEGVRGEKTLV